jgi:hypothetical protein
MGAREFLPEVGKASSCAVAKYHAPRVLRFVWHHIQPEGCGGASTAANLIPVCDSCHYSIHILLWQVANGGVTAERPNRGQLLVAERGYALCVAAGTAGRIPKEA